MRKGLLVTTLFLLLLVTIQVPLTRAQVQDIVERGSFREAQIVIGLPDDEDEDGDGSGPANPDPRCFDNHARFVDCGNGTVTDGATGLIWLKNANCLGQPEWATANDLAASLGDGTHPACELTDGSSPGDWRLPTLGCRESGFCGLDDAVGEFATIFAPTCPAPFILNAAGTGCWSEDDPFTGVLEYNYWSSTGSADDPDNAWGVLLGYGYASVGIKIGGNAVWPVRDGR